MLPVFSYGEVLIDFIPTIHESYTPFVGGAPANVAAAIAKLGGNSHFIGGISEDRFGIKIREQFDSLKIQYTTDLISPNKTAMVLVTLDDEGERSFQFYRDQTADLTVTPEQLAAVNWTPIGIFHFCSNTLIDNISNEATLFALEQAKQKKAVISFDVNLRLNLWPASAKTSILERILNVASLCDLIKFSDEELAYLCVSADMTQGAMLNMLYESGVKLILVTAGAEEIHIVSPEFSTKVTPPSVTAIDTTAGGDSFIGGFLYQLAANDHASVLSALNNKQALTSYVQFAAKCGAFTVTNKGAIEAMPNLNDLTKKFQ